MAILLKTSSVRVSSIQSIQVRVQNKGKSVWKSRYDGDVSLNHHAVMPLSHASTCGRYSRIVGVTSWYQSLPQLRSPLLDRIAGVVESRKCFESYRIIYIGEYDSFTPQSLRRSCEASCVEFWLFSSQISLKKLVSRGYLGIVSMVLWREHCSWCLLSIYVALTRGVELWGVVVTILSLQFWNSCVRRHRKSLLCSCWWDNLDATQYWGVREYCHNSYNGCFRRLRYMIFKGFLVMCWRMDTAGCRAC